jgi:hypothetical protein
MTLRSARERVPTDAWGIVDGYEDTTGGWHAMPAETRRAILAAMGVDPAEPGPPAPPVQVLEPGRPVRLAWPAELRLEDGTTLCVEGDLPADLPFGYHELRPLDGEATVRLIASPGCCYLPRDLRAWGWAVQLYALRSAASWGIGDLADLRTLARWSAADLGAGMVLVNPLHAVVPLRPQQASPYFPSSRRFRNALYLRIEEVPGAAALGADLERLAAAGRAPARWRWPAPRPLPLGGGSSGCRRMARAAGACCTAWRSLGRRSMRGTCRLGCPARRADRSQPPRSLARPRCTSASGRAPRSRRDAYPPPTAGGSKAEAPRSSPPSIRPSAWLQTTR